MILNTNRLLSGKIHNSTNTDSMGKCVSKEPSAITIAASTEYLTSPNNNNNHTNNNNNILISKYSNPNPITITKDDSNESSSSSAVTNLASPSTHQPIDNIIINKSKVLVVDNTDDNNDVLLVNNEWNPHPPTVIISSILKDARDDDEDADDSADGAGRLPVSTKLSHQFDQNKKDTERNNDCGRNNKGQSESKKKSKSGCPETKGTAMSFGFRKILHTTPKKKNHIKDKAANQKQQQQQQTSSDLIEKYDDQQNPEQIDHQYGGNSAELIGENTNFDINDNNGNEGTTTISNEKTDSTWATATTQNIKDNSNNTTATTTNNGGATYKNRFGFRSANVRPASTGITPKITDFQDNYENNNYSAKRRSKSASNTNRAMNSNRSNNDQTQHHHHHQNQVRFDDVPKINHIPYINDSDYYQWKPPERRNYGGGGGGVDMHMITHKPPQHHHQYYGGGVQSGSTASAYNRQHHHALNQQPNTIINTGMHTNIIVRPTPKSVDTSSSVGKFTLHTASLPKPQYPVPISLTQINTMDTKNAKQMANNNRKGFFGPRDISTDSGISSLDNNSTDNNITFGTNIKKLCTNNEGLNDLAATKFNKTRPRNLEMVISGRHKFEVRDLDTISCESIEPLALPKLPSVFSSTNQPVALSGLVRTNTTLNRESLLQQGNQQQEQIEGKTVRINSDTDSFEEEKLYRDRAAVEKHTNKNHNNNSSKNSSPGSSRASWCNAGESLAFKDCSSISSSSISSKDIQNDKTFSNESEGISSITINDKVDLFSSLTESIPKVVKPSSVAKVTTKSGGSERPKYLGHIEETKFAEMAAAVSDILLDDETSPNDSLVSSSESEEAMQRKSKKKSKKESPEKDIDEITPELEATSPMSPGTPTHASNSLSLSDIGKDFLIDDEIADQPALLFNDKNNDNLESMQLASSMTDTPTLMDLCNSKRSPKSLSKSRNLMQAAIELSLRTPISLRKATLLSKAESLDTLSPCESIASDDLMMDFETSSMDSIDRISQSIRSGHGSGMFGLDDTELFNEFENKGGEVLREWNNILKVHRTGRDNIISHLPARATRLLNRSRLQQQTAQQLNTGGCGSDSPKSFDSFNHQNHQIRKPPSSRASSLHYSSNRDSSSDDLLLHDKSFRNSMIQDVLYFKKQLMRLRRILQEEEECLLRTDTLNPFEASNGQFFASSCGLPATSLTTTTTTTKGTTAGNDIDNHQQQNIIDSEKNLGSLQSLTAYDDPIQELADLRRQVVYLQGQVDDRDRTIRFQKNTIDKLEIDIDKTQTLSSASTSISEKEVVNSATQTERVRPISIGQEGLARSKPEYTSYTINQVPVQSATTTEITEISPTNQQHQSSRRHTVISTTFTNLNQIAKSPRRASIAWEKLQYKPVKTTLIGEPVIMIPTTNGNSNNSPTNINKTSSNSNYNKNLTQQKDNNNSNRILLNNQCPKINNSTTLVNGIQKSSIGDNLISTNKNQQHLNGYSKLNGNSIGEQFNTKLSNGNNVCIGETNITKLNNGNTGNSSKGDNKILKVTIMNDQSLKCNTLINKIIKKANNLNEFNKTSTEKINNINSVTIV